MIAKGGARCAEDLLNAGLLGDGTGEGAVVHAQGVDVKSSLGMQVVNEELQGQGE